MISPEQFEELTPLMKQFFTIKSRYQECILLFRLGDFYEMFGDDAKVASKILQIALTTRDRSKDEPIPMCGIPYFSVDNYIGKLIKAGLKVAICEQMQDPKTTKGIVQREVVRIITPGTYTPEQPKENIYIMAVYSQKDIWGLAIADVSTGEFMIYDSSNSLRDEIVRFEPKEIVHPVSFKTNLSFKEYVTDYFTTAVDDYSFDYSEAYKKLLQYFRVASLDGFGCSHLMPSISAAGALLTYLLNTHKNVSFTKISIFKHGDFMFLDAPTRTNLEIMNNLSNGTVEGSLLWVLDETLTPMGGRFLRAQLVKPLLNIDEIIDRQQLIDDFLYEYEILVNIRMQLRKIVDIERICTKILSNTANPRELVSLKVSLHVVSSLKRTITSASHALAKILQSIPDCTDILKLIESAISETPPVSIKDGGIIKSGYSVEIDKLRMVSINSKDYIASLELRERERTGISSLKVGYNKITGYYIEVTKSNLHLVPSDFIRKQTLTNCERYITADLKDFEAQAISAEERLNTLEEDEYLKVLGLIATNCKDIYATSEIIAFLDFITSLTVVAKRHDYVKPIVTQKDTIDIKNGRHPVVEQILSYSPGLSRFIPNDTLLDCDENNLLIITGPNMAGKSTYMRQTALIVLLAHIGSYVPASHAEIGLTDRIFTRIGASDFIAKGQSTFMVEMIETANILNNATAKSLIILDEVGRGTSTFDGISIAWSVAEYILQNIKARTMFATHYHELTELGRKYEGIKNYNVQVREWGEEIIFMRKIAPGAADKSYGIHVAQLAGLPEKVLIRAKEVLDDLEKKELSKYKPLPVQLELFSSTTSVEEELMSVDINKLTPHSALKLIKKLRSMIENG